jgi:hypothetical protein
MFFIPLWMDLSMHAVPAAVLLLGESLDKSDNTTILIMPFSHVHPHLTSPR